LTTTAPVAVMVGHLEVPGLTTDQPTSLTPAVYGLLRSGGYGGPPFDGPVFTDDLSSMKAISDHFGVPDAALRALQAGADVALWVTTDQVPAVLDRLESAVNAGELDRKQVDASVLRLAGFKGRSPRCGH
jgi:beta-N-acetylhexosaminidase